MGGDNQISNNESALFFLKAEGLYIVSESSYFVDVCGIQRECSIFGIICVHLR